MGGILSAFSGQPDQYQASSPYQQSYGQQAVANQANTLAQQQSLGQALQQQMMGGGPNPAQTQYLGNVQNNIANSQGLIASQRGLNPALAARMGANAATTANQQGSMGAALLQQQQQLAAQGQLQNLYGQEQAANLGQQQIYGQSVAGANALNAGAAQQNAQTSTQLAGGLLSGLSTGATLGLLASKGGKVPGKAMVDGDSESNDSVPAMLSPGEAVINREAMQSPQKAHQRLDEILAEKSPKHDGKKTAEFVDHLLKHSGKKEKTYGDVLAARRKKAA